MYILPDSDIMEEVCKIVVPNDTTIFMAFEKGMSFHSVPPIRFANGVQAPTLGKSQLDEPIFMTTVAASLCFIGC